MAATIHVSVDAITDGRSQSQSNGERTRRISPEAGRALEILGHAIEYLIDEYVHETKRLVGVRSSSGGDSSAHELEPAGVLRLSGDSNFQ
jgi:hypothetical protein